MESASSGLETSPWNLPTWNPAADDLRRDDFGMLRGCSMNVDFFMGVEPVNPFSTQMHPALMNYNRSPLWNKTTILLQWRDSSLFQTDWIHDTWGPRNHIDIKEWHIMRARYFLNKIITVNTKCAPKRRPFSGKKKKTYPLLKHANETISPSYPVSSTLILLLPYGPFFPQQKTLCVHMNLRGNETALIGERSNIMQPTRERRYKISSWWIPILLYGIDMYCANEYKQMEIQ